MPERPEKTLAEKEKKIREEFEKKH